ILKGIGEAFQHSMDGHDAYLFGQVSRHGWWYFFPVVLLVKTPLAFMALAGLGAMVAVRGANARASECLAAGMAIVLVSLSSSINIGVRHVLPVYAFAAPVAGHQDRGRTVPLPDRGEHLGASSLFGGLQLARHGNAGTNCDRFRPRLG